MKQQRDRLDELLGSLPDEMPLERDLWPAIEAQLQRNTTAEQAAAVPAGSSQSWEWMRMAAAVVLMVGTCVTALLLTRDQGTPPAPLAHQPPPPTLQAVPVSFGSQTLGSEYIELRSELMQHFQRRMQQLPPQARDSLQRSLDDLQRAASEINAVLAEHPEDPLLQDLLMSTYQSELQLLADAGGGASTRADL